MVPFGLCSTPSCIQKTMRDILDGCAGYLVDEFFVVERVDEDHNRKLDSVLHRLSENRAKLNFDQAELGVDVR